MRGNPFRRPGGDLCLRRHPVTRTECALPDTHYPSPHHDLDGTTWHDGLCQACHGVGESAGEVCGLCGGGGFSLIADPDEAWPAGLPGPEEI